MGAAVASDQDWIGVEEVAAELRYTEREAWEFIRSIGLAGVNARTMKLARFTRAEFHEARDRAKAPLAARAKTGLLGSAATSAQVSAPQTSKSVEQMKAEIRAKLKG